MPRLGSVVHRGTFIISRFREPGGVFHDDVGFLNTIIGYNVRGIYIISGFLQQGGLLFCGDVDFS